jgi:predicted PurR-regulated permease PerM
MLGLDSKAARATWTALAILLLAALLYAIRHTLFIFIVALLFASLLSPVVNFIDRVLPLKRSRAPALAIVYGCLIGAMVVCGIEVGSNVAAQANNLAEKITVYLKPDQPSFVPLPQPVVPLGKRALDAIRSLVQDHYQEILQTLPQTALHAASAATSLIIIVIVPILSFFFLKDGRAIQRYVVSQMDNAVDQIQLKEFAKDLNVLLAQYMRALVLLGLSASVTYGAFFAIMKVPYAALLAALVFPLEFIPMLGPFVSATIIILVAAFSGYPHVVAIVIFLAVYRIFQDYVLSPNLMGAGVELHPLLIIFGVFAGEQIGGIAGAFLSVPVMAVLRLVYQRLEKARIRKEIASDEIVPVSQ